MASPPPSNDDLDSQPTSPPPASTPPPEIAPLDHTVFPHILDQVVAFADFDALLALRCTNHALLQRADAEIYEHAVLVCLSPSRAHVRGSFLVRTPDGRRLPLPKTDIPDSPSLRLILVLDIVDATPADEEHILDGEPGKTLGPFLEALQPQIVRQIGSRRIPPPTSYAQAYVDWTWRSSAPSSFWLYPPAFDPLLLQYEHDTEPHLPPCPRIVLHCPETPMHTALTELLPLIHSLSSRTVQVVVVFSPWPLMTCWEAAIEGVRKVPPLLAVVIDAVEDEVAARRAQLGDAPVEKDQPEGGTLFNLTLVGVEAVHPDPELKEPCSCDLHSRSSLALRGHASDRTASASHSKLKTTSDTTEASNGGNPNIGGADSNHSLLSAKSEHVRCKLLRQAALHRAGAFARGPGAPTGVEGWGDHVHFVTSAEWHARPGPLTTLETGV